MLHNRAKPTNLQRVMSSCPYTIDQLVGSAAPKASNKSRGAIVWECSILRIWGGGIKSAGCA